MTALLEYLNLRAPFLLAVFDAVFFHEISCDATKKMCKLLRNYSRRSSYYSGIIPDSFYHLLFQKLFRHNVRMPKVVILSIPMKAN